MLARLKQMLIKEFIQVFRDKRTRFILIGPPIIQMMVFGYAANYEIRHVPTVVLDLDHSQESRELVSRFTSSPYFDVQRQLTDSRQLGRSDRAGRCDGRPGDRCRLCAAVAQGTDRAAAGDCGRDQLEYRADCLGLYYADRAGLRAGVPEGPHRPHRAAVDGGDAVGGACAAAVVQPRPEEPLVLCAGNHRQPDAGAGDYADRICRGARARDRHAGADHGDADPAGRVHSGQDAAVLSDRPLRCDADCRGRIAVVSGAVSRPCLRCWRWARCCFCCACWAWGC